jgi:CheY-like chemotaxis protein
VTFGKLAQRLRSGIFPGTETILIVEPDPILRGFEHSALSRKYEIVQTSSPEEAVRAGARHRNDLNLLLTRARFPHMEGWELTELLRLDYPKLKVLYVSASKEGSKAHTGLCTIFELEKDGVNVGRLLEAVHDALEAPTQNRCTVRDKTDPLISLHRWAKPPI